MTEMERWIRDNNVQESPYRMGVGIEYESFARDDLGNLVLIRELRWEAIELFSFAICTQQTCSRLASCYGPFLEVGCGTGYWAYEIEKVYSHLKTDYKQVIATDPEPYSCVAVKTKKLWVDVERITAEEAIRKYPDRTLIMCWPSLDREWTGKALEQYTEQGGELLVHIGEFGGCTANEHFFQVLDEHWEEVENLGIPVWWGVHDSCCVFKRKGI